jgi:hypothetical protein
MDGDRFIAVQHTRRCKRFQNRSRALLGVGSLTVARRELSSFNVLPVDTGGLGSHHM